MKNPTLAPEISTLTTRGKALRLIFLPVMAVIALEMVLRGLGVAPI